jgi:hypothetical protein
MSESVSAQLPPQHCGLTPLQELEQYPQLLTSVVTSVQKLLQHCSLPTQISPHEPQLLGSLATSAHVPLQHIGESPVQALLQTPQLSTFESPS